MCFDLDSSPPVPVIRGAAVSHEDLTLRAADGNTFAAFFAAPDEPADVGVVILPDVRGLYRFYEELALRFAERGYAAVAFDYFGRTAGASKRGEDFEYRSHVEQTTTPTVQADVAACIAHLREHGAQTIFTVGFYGRPAEATGRAAELKAPILALQAGADQNITPQDNAAFEQALQAARVEHELVTYEGAPHSFFDRKQEEFADASQDAWAKVLSFLESHS